MKVISLLCMLGLTGLVQAGDKAPACPADHRHMGHGIAGTVMDHAGSAMANAKKIADAVCNDCHGKTGISKADDTPNLTGQEAIYLCKSLDAYRIKARIVPPAPPKKNDGIYVPTMNEVAGKLSDQDIVDLSVYFAHLRAH